MNLTAWKNEFARIWTSTGMVFNFTDAEVAYLYKFGYTPAQAVNVSWPI